MSRKHWRADLRNAKWHLGELADDVCWRWRDWRSECRERRQPPREGNPYIQNFPRIVISEHCPPNAAYLINPDFVIPRPEWTDADTFTVPIKFDTERVGKFILPSDEET